LLSRGFNDAISGFNDDGWSVLGGDGVDDVIMACNMKMSGNNHSPASAFGAPGGIICVKASMLLQVRLH
jgi:homeobox-leucine zipper protein